MVIVTEENVGKGEIYYGPLLNALKTLGNSAPIEDVKAQIIKDMPVPPEFVNEKPPHEGERRNRFEYSLAWACTHLRDAGLMERPGVRDGIWTITQEGLEKATIDPTDLVNYVQTKISEYNKEKSKNKPKEKEKMLQDIDPIDSYVRIIEKSKNLILTGAPGTGKTWTAKDIAEQLIFGTRGLKEEQKEKLSKDDRFKIIQFHPAYTYEDFVRGITIKNGEGGALEYVPENKVLGKLAKEAKDNYDISKSSSEEQEKWRSIDSQFDEWVKTIELEISEKGPISLTPTVFIVEVEKNAFRYKASGVRRTMLFDDLKSAFNNSITTREGLENDKSLTRSTAGLTTYYIKALEKFRDFEKEKPNKPTKSSESVEEKKYVLIIDEINRANLPAVLGELIYALEYRGEPVDSMYSVDGDNELILPPNLYIIGTMNTADRSAGQLDYAIRRRFRFVTLLPEVLNLKGFKKTLFKDVSEFFIKNFDAYCENKNVLLEKSEHLSPEFSPEDVWVGHSYFINANEDRLNYEIKPLLLEYIKDGILNESARDLVNKLTI